MIENGSDSPSGKCSSWTTLSAAEVKRPRACAVTARTRMHIENSVRERGTGGGLGLRSKSGSSYDQEKTRHEDCTLRATRLRLSAKLGSELEPESEEETRDRDPSAGNRTHSTQEDDEKRRPEAVRKLRLSGRGPALAPLPGLQHVPPSLSRGRGRQRN